LSFAYIKGPPLSQAKIFFLIERCIKVPSRCAIKTRTIQGRQVSEKPGFLETYVTKKIFFFNIKLYYDVVYPYYKNQNHLRPRSLWKTGFLETYVTKKKIFLNFSYFISKDVSSMITCKYVSSEFLVPFYN
jgi:hypothetical protein